MEFIEASAFTRYVHHYLNDESYRALQAELAANPDRGEVIPGSGGFRKVRWADTRRGKGGEADCESSTSISNLSSRSG